MYRSKIEQENNKKAREYFGIQDNPDMVLHHIDPSWKTEDIERYIQWNPEDLVVMTRSEHVKLHNQGESNPMYGKHHSDETRQKIAQADKSYTQTDEYRHNMSIAVSGEKNGMYGKKHTDEAKKKMSESHIGSTPWNKGLHSNEGKHRFNNGECEKFVTTCPEGYVKGRLKRYAEL